MFCWTPLTTIVAELAQWLLLIGLLLDALGAVVVITPDLPRFDWIAKGETLKQIESQIEQMPNVNPPDGGPFLERGDDGFDPFVQFLRTITDIDRIPERITVVPVFGPGDDPATPSSYSVVLGYDGSEGQTIGSPDTVRQLAYRYVERRILTRGVYFLLAGFILQIIANLMELMI